jgi:hypothetical protein
MIFMFLPLLLVYLSWRLYHKDVVTLAGWRGGLFLTGLAANATSAAVLISFTIHAYVVSKGTKPVDLDRMYPVLSMLGLGLLAAGLASSGKRIPRVICFVNGTEMPST